MFSHEKYMIVFFYHILIFLSFSDWFLKNLSLSTGSMIRPNKQLVQLSSILLMSSWLECSKGILVHGRAHSLTFSLLFFPFLWYSISFEVFSLSVSSITFYPRLHFFLLACLYIRTTFFFGGGGSALFPGN